MEGIHSKDNFCKICLLSFGTKFIYDIHMSFLHKNLVINLASKSDNKLNINETKISKQSMKEETETLVQDNILPNFESNNLSKKK